LSNWLYTFSALGPEGLSKGAANDLMIVFWAVFTATRLIVAGVAVMASPAQILGITQPLAVIAGIGLLLHPAPSLPLIWGFTLLSATGVSCGFANGIALLSQYSPINGMLNGLICLAAGSGAMLIPPLQGWLLGLSRRSFAVGLLGVACLNLAMLPLILALGKRKEADEEGGKLNAGAGYEPAAEEGGGGGAAGGGPPPRGPPGGAPL